MAIRVLCEQCGAEIPAGDVNVAADTAYCRACGRLSRLSQMLADADAGVTGAAADEPPPGCGVVVDGLNYGTTIWATARNLPAAAGLLFFTLFWNGITSVFVCLALAGTLRLAGVAVPPWFPVPDGHKGNGFGTSVGSAIFLWLFLTPFILIGLTMAAATLVSLLGHVSVRIGPDGGRVFTGVGRIGWPRRFDPSDVASVAVGATTWQRNGQSQPAIVIAHRVGGPLRFGTALTAARRAWLVAAVRHALNSGGRRSPGPGRLGASPRPR